MGWRWYGEGNDPITLSDIKQIPGVEEIVWALHSKMPGEIWEENEIKEVVDQIHAAGFSATVVESVNVHDDIKIGLPTRDKYIENYKQCIRNLSKFGVKTICYNFMPIFDWTRTDLFHPVGDGSTALFYQKDLIKDDYKGMAKLHSRIYREVQHDLPRLGAGAHGQAGRTVQGLRPRQPRKSCGIT